MRLDKYLKISRIIKRRTVANEACDNGRVTLNGRVARASAEVKPGDIIVIAFGNRQTKVEVLAVQENVRKAIETMTGLHVVKVDVHVQGVSFEKEKKALQTGLESAHLTSEENERIQSEVRQVIREERKAEAENGEAEEKADEDSAK